MKRTSGPRKKASAEAPLTEIRRAMRRQVSVKEKIRVVLEGLRFGACPRPGPRQTSSGARSAWGGTRRRATALCGGFSGWAPLR